MDNETVPGGAAAVQHGENKDLHLTRLSFHVSICVWSTASTGYKQRDPWREYFSFRFSGSTHTFFCIKCSSLECGDIFSVWPLVVNTPSWCSLLSTTAFAEPVRASRPVCVRARVSPMFSWNRRSSASAMCSHNSRNSRSQTRAGKHSGWFPNISQIFCLCTRLHLFFVRSGWFGRKVKSVAFSSPVTHSWPILEFLWGDKKCSDLSWVRGDVSWNKCFSLWWNCLFWIFTFYWIKNKTSLNFKTALESVLTHVIISRCFMCLSSSDVDEVRNLNGCSLVIFSGWHAAQPERDVSDFRTWGCEVVQLSLISSWLTLLRDFCIRFRRLNKLLKQAPSCRQLQ